MVAIGEVHPDKIVTLSRAQAGDALVLTKPIGTGVLGTALKRDLATAADLAPAVTSMTTLNAGASRAMLAVGVHAATDVTGFGLLGHLHNMLSASGVAATLDSASIPLLRGATDAVQKGAIPGGTKRNREALSPHVTFKSGVDEVIRVLLFDAQTSGGLLIAVPEDRAMALRKALEKEGTIAAALIGRVVAGTPGTITVS
jgi:selenide,water dikinase